MGTPRSLARCGVVVFTIRRAAHSLDGGRCDLRPSAITNLPFRPGCWPQSSPSDCAHYAGRVPCQAARVFQAPGPGWHEQVNRLQHSQDHQQGAQPFGWPLGGEERSGTFRPLRFCEDYAIYAPITQHTPARMLHAPVPSSTQEVRRAARQPNSPTASFIRSCKLLTVRPHGQYV